MGYLREEKRRDSLTSTLFIIVVYIKDQIGRIHEKYYNKNIEAEQRLKVQLNKLFLTHY